MPIPNALLELADPQHTSVTINMIHHPLMVQPDPAGPSQGALDPTSEVHRSLDTDSSSGDDDRGEQKGKYREGWWSGE